MCIQCRLYGWRIVENAGNSATLEDALVRMALRFDTAVADDTPRVTEIVFSATKLDLIGRTNAKILLILLFL